MVWGALRLSIYIIFVMLIWLWSIWRLFLRHLRTFLLPRSLQIRFTIGLKQLTLWVSCSNCRRLPFISPMFYHIIQLMISVIFKNVRRFARLFGSIGCWGDAGANSQFAVIQLPWFPKFPEYYSIRNFVIYGKVVLSTLLLRPFCHTRVLLLGNAARDWIIFQVVSSRSTWNILNLVSSNGTYLELRI